MVQELQVLKCCSCFTFQVHIVKKAKKWDCKICNQKQSIKEVFGRGSGKDCRVHAQKLNALRAERDGSNLTDDQFSAFLAASSHQVKETAHPPAIIQATSSIVRNKWNKYLENNDPEDETPEEDNRHLLQGPIYQKKKRQKLCGDSKGQIKNEAFVKSSNITAVQNFTQEKQDDSLVGVHSNQRNGFSTTSGENPILNQNLSKKSNKPSLNNLFQGKYMPSSVSKGSGGEVKRSSGFNHSSNLIDVKKPSVSKWSKYLCIETDNENDHNQSNELYDDSISSNISKEEYVYNALNVTSKSLESCISSNKSLTSCNTTSQQFTNNPLVVNEKQEMFNGSNELLQSLFELKNQNETTEPCTLASTITLSTEESKNISVKRKFNMFEDDDLAWLDQVEDF